MIKIALCDDEKTFLNLTEEKVRRYCSGRQVDVKLKCYVDSDELAEDIEAKRGHDIYILDIDMPNYSGMNIAELVEKYSEDSYIIYLTSYDKFAARAYGVSVAGYVLKSQLDSSLEEILDKIFERIERKSAEKTYAISNERRYVKLLHKDIIYIYKEEKNVIFVLANGTRERERTTLQKVYRKLDHSNMYALGRHAILNLCNVMRITDKKIIMKDGYEIEAGRACVNELKEHMISYLEGNL